MSGRIARLSLSAIKMAAAASFDDVKSAASWLYRFGIAPRSSAIDRDFGPDDDPMAVLGLAKGGSVRRLLSTVYEAHSFPAWYSFELTDSPPLEATVCKLYASPAPEALPDTFPTIAEQFARLKVRSFKVGRGIDGLVRPDKIVAYFYDRAHMQDVAGALSEKLGKCPVQGVPFTAAAGGDGLLSFGVDPPVGPEVVSWRSWVTNRLAASLTMQRSDDALDCVTRALEDMYSVGVDPTNWTPTTESFWKTEPPCNLNLEK